MPIPLHRLATLLVAAAVAVTLASCASTTTPRSTPSSTGPAASPTPSAGQQPLPGPNVLAAEMLGRGSGYVRTTDSLLWTDDFGMSWRTITPPGITPARSPSWRNTATAILPDGHLWLAPVPAVGATSVTVLRADSPGGPWRRVQIPLGPLKIQRPGYGAAGVSLSFANSQDGWLLVSWSVTHESAGELFATTDGGATWTLRAGRAQLPSQVGPIRFLTPTVGVMDLNGAWLPESGWWITRDAGLHWTALHLPMPAANKGDVMAPLAAPALAGGAIVVAEQFTTPVQGDDAGLGIFRSTDAGRSWTVQPIATPTGAGQYTFAVTPSGSTYLLLHSPSGPSSQSITWVAARSTDGGRSFTDTASAQNAWPGRLTASDADHLWSVATANGCKSFKTDCWSTSALFASTDGGRSWNQVALPA